MILSTQSTRNESIRWCWNFSIFRCLLNSQKYRKWNHKKKEIVFIHLMFTHCFIADESLFFYFCTFFIHFYVHLTVKRWKTKAKFSEKARVILSVKRNWINNTLRSLALSPCLAIFLSLSHIFMFIHSLHIDFCLHGMSRNHLARTKCIVTCRICNLIDAFCWVCHCECVRMRKIQVDEQNECAHILIW